MAIEIEPFLKGLDLGNILFTVQRGKPPILRIPLCNTAIETGPFLTGCLCGGTSFGRYAPRFLVE